MSKDAENFPEISFIREKLRKPVVLIGMMGVGKTRIGRKLADSLNLAFYDTDHEIETKAGRSVADIFAQEGEGKFREVEKKTLMELVGAGVAVIATGGGAIVNEGIPEFLEGAAITVWLKADIQEILRRVKKGAARPLLKQGDPEAVLTALMEKRAPFYARANISIDTTAAVADESVKRLINSLYGFLKKGSFQG